jgi:hypothetical protein
MDRAYHSSGGLTDSAGEDERLSPLTTECTDSNLEDMEFNQRNITSSAIKQQISKAWAEEFSDRLEDYLSEGGLNDPNLIRDCLPNSEELDLISQQIDS